jgi:hypothetical protein
MAILTRNGVSKSIQRITIGAVVMHQGTQKAVHEDTMWRRRIADEKCIKLHTGTNSDCKAFYHRTSLTLSSFFVWDLIFLSQRSACA